MVADQINVGIKIGVKESGFGGRNRNGRVFGGVTKIGPHLRNQSEGHGEEIKNRRYKIGGPAECFGEYEVVTDENIMAIISHNKAT